MELVRVVASVVCSDHQYFMSLICAHYDHRTNIIHLDRNETFGLYSETCPASLGLAPTCLINRWLNVYVAAV